VKTTGQIISVFQRRQGFPFASAERPEQEASGAASGPRRVRTRKSARRGNNGVGGNPL